MKLRSQMLMAGVLTLAVPIVGWQSVKQLYSALQQTRVDEQNLKVANMRLVVSEATEINQALASAMQSKGESDWYAQPSRYPLFVDGYDDDWQTLVAKPHTLVAQDSPVDADELSLSISSARRDKKLFLFLSVSDASVQYHTPPEIQTDLAEGELPDLQSQLVNGDAIELLLKDTDGHWQHGLFRAIAPGALSALTASDKPKPHAAAELAGQVIPGWQSAWQKTVGGYQLEIALPIPPNGTVLELAVIDVDEGSTERNRWLGTMNPATMAAIHRDGEHAVLHGRVDDGLQTRLFYDSESIRDRLQPWITPGVRARLFDVHGRPLADVNSLYTRLLPEEEAAAYSSDGLLDALLMRVFAFFIAGDLPLLPDSYRNAVSLSLSEARRQEVQREAPVTSRYVTDENDRVLGTLASLGSNAGRGYLLFEANEEHASAYAGSELARLFSLLLVVSLLAGCGLLIFATVLSSRIRKLSREAQHAVTDDGRVRGLPGSEAQDEIGDLSRKLSSLLARSAAYNQYLEALSGRLSHELRTPLSVVRTSIENLDRDQLDEQSQILIDRASGGADHLSAIIKALVESTRMEQTVQQAQMQPVRIGDWMQASLQRYSQVYRDVEFQLSPDVPQGINVQAAPELLQQAFDKLVDNAVGYSIDAPIVLYAKLTDASMKSGVGSPARHLALAVANQGEALDESLLEQVFEPMFSSRDPHASGPHMGLGLYIVRMIAQVHGGTVFARNKKAWVVIGMSLPAE